MGNWNDLRMLAIAMVLLGSFVPWSQAGMMNESKAEMSSEKPMETAAEKMETMDGEKQGMSDKTEMSDKAMPMSETKMETMEKSGMTDEKGMDKPRH